jgi:glycosyl transferase family 25
MTKTLHIYYINLDRSPERAKFINDQFNSTNVKLTRVQAIDGSSLDKYLISDVQKSQSIFAHFQKPKSGEIGAFFSHQAAWNLIANQDEDFSIVIEDDGQGFPEKMCLQTFHNVMGCENRIFQSSNIASNTGL